MTHSSTAITPAQLADLRRIWWCLRREGHYLPAETGIIVIDSS